MLLESRQKCGGFRGRSPPEVVDRQNSFEGTLMKDGNARCHHERFAYIVGNKNRRLTELGAGVENAAAVRIE